MPIQISTSKIESRFRQNFHIHIAYSAAQFKSNTLALKVNYHPDLVHSSWTTQATRYRSAFPVPNVVDPLRRNDAVNSFRQYVPIDIPEKYNGRV